MWFFGSVTKVCDVLRVMFCHWYTRTLFIFLGGGKKWKFISWFSVCKSHTDRISVPYQSYVILWWELGDQLTYWSVWNPNFRALKKLNWRLKREVVLCFGWAGGWIYSTNMKGNATGKMVWKEDRSSVKVVFRRGFYCIYYISELLLFFFYGAKCCRFSTAPLIKTLRSSNRQTLSGLWQELACELGARKSLLLVLGLLGFSLYIAYILTGLHHGSHERIPIDGSRDNFRVRV